jgi:nitrite reductase/ring-hydroxylating ferredoxin subunit
LDKLFGCVAQSRRRFLEVLAAAAISGEGVACSNAGPDKSGDPEPIGDVDAGQVADFPLGTFQAIGTIPVAIGRDDGGLFAVTLTCTHAGCNMAVDGQVGPGGIFCACHGSRFTIFGDVTQGPARRPLVHFAVEVDANGNVTIKGGEVVASETRTAFG